MQLNIAGKPQFIDRLSIDNGGEHLRHGIAGLQHHTVWGTLVAGPFLTTEETGERVEMLRDTVAEDGAENRIAVTAMNGLIVARYIGDSANQGREHFVRLWQKIRPCLLHRPACPPRIWAT